MSGDITDVWTATRRFSLSRPVADVPDLVSADGRTVRPDLVHVEAFDRAGKYPHRSITIHVSGYHVRKDGHAGAHRGGLQLDATRLDTYSAARFPDWLREVVAPALSVVATALAS
jgi:hypothetical protein